MGGAGGSTIRKFARLNDGNTIKDLFPVLELVPISLEHTRPLERVEVSSGELRLKL